MTTNQLHTQIIIKDGVNFVKTTNTIYSILTQNKPKKSLRRNSQTHWLLHYVFGEDLTLNISKNNPFGDAVTSKLIKINKNQAQQILSKLEEAISFFGHKATILVIKNTLPIQDICSGWHTHLRESKHNHLLLQAFPSILIHGKQAYFISKIAQRKCSKSTIDTLFYANPISENQVKFLLTTSNPLYQEINENSAFINSEKNINPGLTSVTQLTYTDRQKAWENVQEKYAIDQLINSKNNCKRLSLCA